MDETTKQDLARRAVACRGWRWMRGMVTACGCLVREEVAESDEPPPWGTDTPDLDDPAVAGVLLGMLPRGMLIYDHGDEDGWEIREPMGYGSRTIGEGLTLGVAVARALLSTWEQP